MCVYGFTSVSDDHDSRAKKYHEAGLIGPEVWISARLVQHNPCGVSTVRIRQGGTTFLIGVDKSSIHELSVTSRLDPVK